MSRVYSVKSNARRDARKLGLDPNHVVARGDGWIIDYPDTPKKESVKDSPLVKAKPVVKRETKPEAINVARSGGLKRDRLIAMLAAWTPLEDIMTALDWQAHTVRGALSTAAKVQGIAIERRRVDGVTSYRVAGIEAAE